MLVLRKVCKFGAVLHFVTNTLFMAYHFYNTLEKLEKKVEELEKELEQAQGKYNLLVLENQGQEKLEELALQLRVIRRNVKFFSRALTETQQRKRRIKN